MEAKDLGLATPGDGAATPPEGSATAPNTDGGQQSNDGTGTGDGTATQPPEGTDTKTPEEIAAEAAASGGGEGDPQTKRINDLMGKWQSEEHNHGETKTELDAYKAKFGEIDGTTPPASTPNLNNAQNVVDPSLPAALQPGWAPETMQDLQDGLRDVSEYGASKALETINAQQRTQVDAEQQIKDFVVEVKSVDSEFDDKAFFAYANQHSFPVASVRDLRSVYSSYITLQRATKDATQTALKNKDARGNPVGKPGGEGGGGNLPSFQRIQNANSAQDLIHDALNK